MQSIFHGVREYLTPILTESSFEQKGILTPEEFVKAGDLLVYKCPTWQWESGQSSARRPYLPADKQYLVTRNVPCRQRITALDTSYQCEEAVDGESDWVSTSSYPTVTSLQAMEQQLDHISLKDDTPFPTQDEKITQNLMNKIVEDFISADGTKSEPNFPDLSTFEEENLVEDKAALSSSYLVATEPMDDAILRTRTYDLSITYDKYYQTPRVWLFGYDENNYPLDEDAIFQDIMQDYAKQTVTMEPHPHNPTLLHASIHPCQHAAVMKRIISNLTASASHLRSDQYLFVFLKFIQSVIPTIDYDHTVEVDAK
uniref:Autophagocytosis associated protein putative n=1 Tax=Albugo laibachii Nc14 TaxID=890382 RepID=F0W7Y3_9STRA|nr:autophagocytosis associated protein putative [Albugo laibachii Nc14]|eukprot:CCA17236.1 autophagocytosis associated protein putative [Albugo laibachii Nc14]